MVSASACWPASTAGQTATAPATGLGGGLAGAIPPAAWSWVCLDIETMGGNPDEVEAGFLRAWAPDKRWKPETIGTRFLEALAKRQEKAALLNSASIAAVAMHASDGALKVLHGLGAVASKTISGAEVVGYTDESALLVAVREILDIRTDGETLVVGHAIDRFDLPRLRFRYLANGLKLPGILAGTPRTFDSMRMYGKMFSVQGEPFIALSDLLELFGMPCHKGVADGAQVGELIAGGQLDALATYAALDVLAEAQVFQAMTGQVGK